MTKAGIENDNQGDVSPFVDFDPLDLLALSKFTIETTVKEED